MKKLLFIVLLFITACDGPKKSSTVNTIINSKIDSIYTIRYSDFIISEYWIENYKITIAEDGVCPLQFVEGEYEIIIDNGEIIKEKSKTVNTFTNEELDDLIVYLKNNSKK